MSIHATHQKKADEPAEEFEFAAATGTKVNVLNCSKNTTYTVTVSTDGAAIECTCPHHIHRHAYCKHMAGVEVNLDNILDDDQDQGGEPEITYHVEPPEQGGARYARCERCAAESVRGADSIVHRDGC